MIERTLCRTIEKKSKVKCSGITKAVSPKYSMMLIVAESFDDNCLKFGCPWTIPWNGQLYRCYVCYRNKKVGDCNLRRNFDPSSYVYDTSNSSKDDPVG